MTGKIQTWLCRTVDPTFVGSPEPLAHGRNIVSRSLFCKYYFGESSSELAELVPFLYSCGRCTRALIISCVVFLLSLLNVSLPTVSFLVHLDSDIRYL